MPEGGPQARRLRDAPLLRDAAGLIERNRIPAVVLLLAAMAVSAIALYEVVKRPADVHNEAVPFKPEKPKKPPPKPHTVNWPMFGLNAARTRYLAVKGVKPPFRLLWHYSEKPLLEFPPVYAGGKLYAVNNNGLAFALDADTGKVLWERRVGRLNASSPSYARHRLFIVNLVPGHIVKLNAETGRIVWKKPLPGRAESSPLVIGRTVYFGCEDGKLYALSTINGNIRWTTQLGGPVKSAPAFYHGILYVGDYSGYMNAVNAKTGKLKWQSGSLGQGFGTSGEFYSTPAVAFGRVYAGNNDDRVYSYDLHNGALAWSFSTGGYVYSGPTVASTPQTPPTVYIGSFDGNIYALNAKTGEPRWQRSAGGQVIGSLSAVGNIVYVAEFNSTSTNGFDMKTGRKVFHFKTGAYTPVISDGRRLYLTGYSSINALEPLHPKKKKAKGAQKKQGRKRQGRSQTQAGHRPPAHPARAGAGERGQGAGSGSG